MRARYLILIAGLFANSNLWADEYPVSGVWVNASTAAADTDTFCRSYWKNPKAPIGPIVVFGGSKRTDYNGGYLEVEVVNNVAVRKSAPNEYSIVDQYYDDGEGGGRSGQKRRTYKLRILGENKIEMREAKYRGEVFVKCSPPSQAANNEGGVTGPSFDCSKASLPDERAICGDQKLGEIDRLIGASYAEVRKKLGNQIDQQARSFLSKRHQCGASRLCIVDAQLEALSGYRELGSGTALPEWVAAYRASLVREGAASPTPRIEFLKGECSTTLDGVDIGCNGSVVHSALGNGRHLINFPNRDVATIGFAGGRLTKSGDKSAVLWIDRVYINQAVQSADGQCAIEIKNDKARLECRAIARDGRKVVGALTSDETTTTFLQTIEPKQSPDQCVQIVKTHGFLSRAQFQCGFKQYSNQMIEAAQKCAAEIGADETKRALASGFATFDQNEKGRGHAVICREITKSFSNFVKK